MTYWFMEELKIMGIMILMISPLLAMLFIIWKAWPDDELSEEAEDMKSDMEVELIWERILMDHYPGALIGDRTTQKASKEVRDMTPEQFIGALQERFRGPIRWKKEGREYHIEYNSGKIKYFIDGKEV